MKQEAQNELKQMQMLMERMDKHYTQREVEALNESLFETSKVSRNNFTQMDGTTYNLSTPEELIQTLSKKGFSPKRGWFVTLGYVKRLNKLGDKEIKGSVESFDDSSVESARSIGSERINGLIDNPQYIEKGKGKGNIRNPYMPNSKSNYIVEVSIMTLMYGRNDVWGKQKEMVKNDLARYQSENPEDVQYYMDTYNSNPRNANRQMISFADQSYDDARAKNYDNVPDTNIKHYLNGKYEFSFNTPKGIFKKAKTQYYLITDEDNIEPISKEEVKAYANLYGVIPQKKVETDEIFAKVKNAIEDAKLKNHKGDVWTTYDLDSVFLMNFTPEDGNGSKLQYYNPNAIVEFVEQNELKSGTVPARRTTPGAMSKYFDTLKQE